MIAAGLVFALIDLPQMAFGFVAVGGVYVAVEIARFAWSSR